jgi:dTDP-4-amino-4,6-dideoxygalactose transaminase
MKIPFNDLTLHHRLLQPGLGAAIDRIIAESAFIRGPEVDQFEQSYAQLMGVKRCVSCANGTDALYIAMKGLGIKPGDEVITTAHSWISTSETITQAGGRVVFCDTEDESFTIDPSKIEGLITPRTVGIIPVHLYGHPADMESIMAIARKHKLWVIEDCAQAHLATINGKIIGTYGDAATFSFYPGKNLGALGDAGCLITNNEKLADWCEIYARHGGKGDHQIEGINSRLDGLQAAVLNVKLPHLPKWTSLRQKHAARYDELLGGIDSVKCPTVRKGVEHVYHLYVIRCQQRDALKKHLTENGVSTVLNYPKALPFYPAYKYLGHAPEDFPVAYKHQHEILSLPIYPEMTDDQIGYVAGKVASFFKS